jgi:anti-sigma B factor antagonist
VTDDNGVDLSVEVRTTDGVAVIDVEGDVDLVSGPRLTREIKQAIVGGGVHEIVVDLSKTRFLDSSGIAVLLAGRREAADHDVEYRVQSPSGIVREVLTMTGVWDELSRGRRA